MLSQTTLDITARINKRLNKDNITLVAKTGSPMALLAASCAMDSSQVSPGTPSLLAIAEDSRTYGAVAGNESIHDEKLGWVVDLIVKGVSKDLDVAKNIIAPTIKATLDDIESDLTSALSQPSHNCEIIQSTEHTILSNDKMVKLFERYATSHKKPMGAMLVFPELTLADVQARLVTGDDEVNEQLSVALTPEVAEDVITRFNKYFREGGSRVIEPDYLGTPTVMVALYFLMIGLELNMPDGVNGSINSVTQHLQMVRGLLGACIYSEIRRFDRALANKELILEVGGDSYNRIITVNKTVYNSFLDDGGTPEALLGAINSNHSLTYGSIIDNKAKLEKRWDLHLETIKTSNDLNKLTLIISSIRKSLSNAIDDMEILPAGCGSKGDMQDRLVKAGKNIYLSDLDRLPETVKRIVFDVIFPEQTNARFIIDNLDDMGAKGEDVKLNATNVVISLIGEWLVKNIEVGHCDGEL